MQLKLKIFLRRKDFYKDKELFDFRKNSKDLRCSNKTSNLVADVLINIFVGLKGKNVYLNNRR